MSAIHTLDSINRTPHPTPPLPSRTSNIRTLTDLAPTSNNPPATPDLQRIEETVAQGEASAARLNATANRLIATTSNVLDQTKATLSTLKEQTSQMTQLNRRLQNAELRTADSEKWDRIVTKCAMVVAAVAFLALLALIVSLRSQSKN